MTRCPSQFRFFVCCLTFLLLLVIPLNQADAHAYSAGYTSLTVTKSGIELVYSLDNLSVIELTDGDANHNGVLEQSEFDAVKDTFLSTLERHIQLRVNQIPQEWPLAENIELSPESEGLKVVVKVLYPLTSSFDSLSLTDNLYLNDTVSANYVNLVSAKLGNNTDTAALSGNYREWSKSLSDVEYAGLPQDPTENSFDEAGHRASESTSTATSGWLSFLQLGMSHILGGYDHLLFLFSLLIAKQKFKQYAAMITAFTVAHSITLSLTVLGILQVPSTIVEPAIALSICYVSIDNMVRQEVSHRWLLTFLFGLIHGMGFADILIEMEIPKANLAADLISFNLGIEVVQITLVAILLPLLALLHRWRFSRRAVLGGSTLAFLLGGIWLVERVIG